MKKVSNDFKKRESIWKIIIYTLALIGLNEFVASIFVYNFIISSLVNTL